MDILDGGKQRVAGALGAVLLVDQGQLQAWAVRVGVILLQRRTDPGEHIRQMDLSEGAQGMDPLLAIGERLEEETAIEGGGQLALRGSGDGTRSELGR